MTPVPAKAREVGAVGDPPVYTSKWLGITHFKRVLKADKMQAMPDLLVAFCEEISQREGRPVTTFKMKTLGQSGYLTCDPRNIQAMLSTQFQDFGLGEIRRKVLLPALGDGIFVQDGPAWEHSRALLRPNFVRDQVSDLDLEERHVQNLLQVLPVQADGWTAETDIQELFFRLTLDSATEFLFGESVEAQLAEVGQGTNSTKSAEQRRKELDFSRHFDTAQVHAARRFRHGKLYWLHNPKEFRDSVKVMQEFIAPYVQMAVEKGSSAEKQSAEKEPAEKDAGRYIFLDELATRTRDPEELRAQLLNILLAGRDTTASLLSWLFHELLRHPDVFDKLRSAVISSFGTYDDPRALTFANLKDCQLLRHCLNETLRLWPVVPVNGRQARKHTTLPFGGGPRGDLPILIPAGTGIDYSVHIMHRRKDIWGPDANEFRPERFVDRKPGWSFLPFNGGPRICIGQQFALTEASYVTVRLLQKFDRIETRPEELQGFVRSNLTLTNSPGRPVRLKLHAAA